MTAIKNKEKKIRIFNVLGVDTMPVTVSLSTALERPYLCPTLQIR